VTVRIQPENWEDEAGIRAVHLAAFPTPLEADLVRALHDDLDSVISLVARDGGNVVGHVLLSRMKVEGDGREYRALGLAPVAVTPDRQGQGIGSELIEDALRRAERLGEELVFVLGEPDYYQRFGFDPKSAAPFASPYSGPHFMAKSFAAELPSSGTASYAPAFARIG
jgi:putative acetyltransferase